MFTLLDQLNTVNIAHKLLLFHPLFHFYFTFELSFPTRPSFFKHNSAHIHPSSTNSIQLFDHTPFSIQHNLSCKYIMHCAYGSLEITFMLWLWSATSACTSVIFYWNESINACVGLPIRHVDVKCTKSYLLIALISIMTALHTSHVGLVLFGRRSCHTCCTISKYQSWTGR